MAQQRTNIAAEMPANLETLCELPPACAADAVTADGHIMAFSQDATGGLQFIWDGVAGEPFDGLNELRDKSAPVFVSDDGAHIAYMGLRGDRQFVGRDGFEDPPFDAISRSVPPTFGGAGRHLAYGAHLPGGEYRLIVDGEPVGSGTLAPTAVVFSPDGDRLAYLEIRGETGQVAECRIVLDGRPGDWFAGIRNAPGMMQFSPDGTRFAHCAIDGKGHLQWFVDGVPQRLVNEVMSLSLARLRGIGVLQSRVPAGFSPDGRRFAYFADVVEKGVAIIEDDVPGPLFKAVGFPVFSPDSRHLAYMAQTQENRTVVVVDGITTPELPGTGSALVVFSPDSKRVARTLEREAGGFLRKHSLFTVAVDGQAYPEEQGDDASIVPTFSPDGGRVAWWLQRGTETSIVVDGVLSLDAPPIVSDFRFAPSGRIVYAGRVGTSETIVVGDRVGPLADRVEPLVTALENFTHEPAARAPVPFRLSAEGEHVAWAGVFDDQVRPVLDDEVGPPFDLIFDCAFDTQRSAIWWAQRGEEVIRITRPLA